MFPFWKHHREHIHSQSKITAYEADNIGSDPAIVYVFGVLFKENASTTGEESEKGGRLARRDAFGKLRRLFLS